MASNNYPPVYTPVTYTRNPDGTITPTNRPADAYATATEDAAARKVPVAIANFSGTIGLSAQQILSLVDTVNSTVSVAVVNGLLVFTTGATTLFAVSVDTQRTATLTNLPAGAVATDYEYQFRPAPTVTAQRVADLTQTLAAGESAADYEYQVR